MAKIYLNRLAKKYGIDPNNVSGENYQILMNKILARNTQNIEKATARLSDEHWKKNIPKLSTPGKRFILPDVSETLPDNQVYIKKTADSGKLITNSLRTRLSKDLQEVLKDFRTEVTDEPAFIRRRGTRAGTINPKVVDLFQEKITETFLNYTKKDSRFGVPANVRTIAVTEARSAIHDIKRAYADQLLSRNPGIRMKKRWIQNKSISKNPRRGHSEVHGTVVAYSDKFLVPLYNKQQRRIAVTPMTGPHDPAAPKAQVISCSCDLEIFVEVVE